MCVCVCAHPRGVCTCRFLSHMDPPQTTPCILNACQLLWVEPLNLSLFKLSSSFSCLSLLELNACSGTMPI